MMIAHPGEKRELPVGCVSIDVEEYFHIEAAHGRIAKSDWDRWPSRVAASVDRLLLLFDRHKVHGTFFVLGHVARHHPQVVRAIDRAGHEIASHGTMHDRLHRLDRQSFGQDLNTSKALLQEIIGKPVIGYRAPTFSIMPETAWAIDVLIESGFRYDASIFPVRHPWYGVPDAPDRPYFVQSKANQPTLLEIPPLTWTRSARRKMPVAGGGYFRLLPLWFMKQGLKQAARQQRPAVLYFHPWEFDPGIPKMPLGLSGRIRTYSGLASAQRKLASILARPMHWVRLSDALDEFQTQARTLPVWTLGGPG